MSHVSDYEVGVCTRAQCCSRATDVDLSSDPPIKQTKCSLSPIHPCLLHRPDSNMMHLKFLVFTAFLAGSSLAQFESIAGFEILSNVTNHVSLKLSLVAYAKGYKLQVEGDRSQIA